MDTDPFFFDGRLLGQPMGEHFREHDKKWPGSLVTYKGNIWAFEWRAVA